MKIFNSIIFFFLTFSTSFGQNANVSYEVRISSIYSTDGSSVSGSSCWESTNEEYSANLRIDNPTLGTNFCMIDAGAGASSTYGGGTVLRTSANVSTTNFLVVYDIFEDDGGVRCTFDGGDDCRAVGNYSNSFVDNYYPTTLNSFTNYTDNQVYNSGSSQHNIRINNSWRYSGTSSAITPTCAAQTTTYTAGGIRSWSVYLTAGVTYNFNSCASASNDTYLRLYSTDGFTIVGTGDDNCGVLSIINYTAPTTGWHYVELSQFSRGPLAAGGTLTYSIVPKVGATLGTPIIAGTLSCGVTYSNIQSNVINTGFCNDYGQASDDIYYSFTLSNPATVNISHCGSGFDTYLSLLNSVGGLISSNDDNGVLCAGSAASLQMGLAAGTYYVVSEGYGANTGNINTQISIQATNNPGAITAPTSICVGGSTSISNVTAATGASAVDVPSYYYYWQRTSAPVVGWTMYDGPTSNLTSALPPAVTNTPGTYILARNSAFDCFGQVSAPFINLTVDAVATLGTLSNLGPINFCDAGGNFTTAVNVSGQVGSIMWDWGSNNGVWNNNWVAGANSGICCFPKKTSNSDGNADRIRYRVTNGSCPAVTSGTILIRNKYNEAPTSLVSSSSVYCSSAAPATITLTANFPSNINMNGTVSFYSGSCGGTLVGSVSPSATSTSAALTITAPASTTTYYARYEPGSGSGCSNSVCVSSTITVDANPTLGTLSNAGPINFCDAGGNFTTAVNVTGQVGTILWNWGSNNGAWNAWVAGANSGVCCFPKKTSNSDGNADRIRYRVSNGVCPSVTSATILIRNRYNEAPTSLVASSSTYCANAAPATVTLTANFPTNINMNGMVSFYSGSCGGTLVGSVSPSATSATAALTIAAPASTTTYFVRYEPGTGSGCSNTACVSTTVTVNILSSAPTISPFAGTICPNTNYTLTAAGGTAGSGSTISWYSGPAGTGSLLGTGGSLTVAPTATTTYYVRREGSCNTTSDASVTVNVKTYVYAANGTSTNTYCTDNAGYSHFFVGDNIILSVQGDISGAAVGFPVATITNNGSYYQQTQGPGTVAGCASNQNPGEERFEMSRSWNLDMGGGAPIGTYNVRFYYPSAEKTAIETAAANHMATYPSCGYSYKYATPNGFFWFKNSGSNYSAPQYDLTQYSASIGTTVNGINYSQWTGIPGFSGGSGAVILIPAVGLPIELESFQANCEKDNVVEVTWKTVSEHNSDYFIVERSRDGISWLTIGTVAAATNSSSLINYSLTDDQGLEGVSYYRLTQYDLDGASETFNVISLNCSTSTGENAMKVYPNPNDGNFNVDLFTSDAAGESVLKITNSKGQIIYTKNIDVMAGNNMYPIKELNLAPGIYFLSIDNGSFFSRIIKLEVY